MTLFNRACACFVFPDRQVMTQNFEGKRKKILGKRSLVHYKRPNFKRAIVTLDVPRPGGSASEVGSWQ